MDTKCLGLAGLVILYFFIQGTFAWWPIGLVRFSNSLCTTQEGYTGTCYRSQQCTDIGGLVSGTCANGIGRCCLFQGNCGGSSSYNNTYFTNSGYPGTLSGAASCTFTIVPCSTSICQVRLDLLNFILAQPDGNGNCIYDSMVITGGASYAPIICGENSGQHMYLTVDGTNSIQITISTSSSVSLARSWNIMITQIACDCPTLAPNGCLQYYTSESDTVNSFNYGTTINPNLVTLADATTVAGSRQIANLNYGVCVNMLPGYCSIQWDQGSDSVSFTVTDDTANVLTTVGLPGLGYIGGTCTTDYVVIPNPYYTDGTAVTADRFCGNEFTSVVTFSKPFVMTVITDANETPDAANRGFSLDYTQIPCSNLAYLIFTAK